VLARRDDLLRMRMGLPLTLDGSASMGRRACAYATNTRNAMWMSRSSSSVIASKCNTVLCAHASMTR
jgi:hypothetical protein